MNTTPLRKLEGQKTRLGRTMHSIVYNEIHDEFTVPQPFSQSILTFRGGSGGEEAPIRVIQGPSTQLAEPVRLTVDTVHDEIIVPLLTSDRVLVFPRDGNGDVAPIRILEGPDTQLGSEMAVVDPIRDLLVIGGIGDDGLAMRVFERTAEGNAKPLRRIGGEKSMFTRIGGPFAIYPPKGWLIATVRGRGAIASEQAFAGIWHIDDDGEVPPRWTIGGPNGIFKMPRGVAVDEKHKSFIISDKRLNAVLTFYFPEAF